MEPENQRNYLRPFKTIGWLSIEGAVLGLLSLVGCLGYMINGQKKKRWDRKGEKYHEYMDPQGFYHLERSNF